MTCAQCPECRSQGPSALREIYRCALSGAEVWPDEDEVTAVCPITLELGRVAVSVAMREYATSAIVAAHRRGKVEELVSYYNRREQHVLRKLLEAWQEKGRQAHEDAMDARARKGKTSQRRKGAAKAGRKKLNGRSGGWGKGTIR